MFFAFFVFPPIFLPIPLLSSPLFAAAAAFVSRFSLLSFLSLISTSSSTRLCACVCACTCCFIWRTRLAPTSLQLILCRLPSHLFVSLVTHTVCLLLSSSSSSLRHTCSPSLLAHRRSSSSLLPPHPCHHCLAVCAFVLYFTMSSISANAKKAIAIGRLFLTKYYETLSFSPEKLHTLYVADAVFSTGDEAPDIAPYVGTEVC
jgi:hypothetical protein